MDNNIIKIVDRYIKKTETLINNANETQCFELSKFQNIGSECIKEVSNLLGKSYDIINFQYKDELLGMKSFRLILDHLGLMYSDKMFKDNKTDKYKNDMKTRLFMMFIKTTDEIIYLLQGGYSVCAMSRIRYIYEVCVFMELINKSNEEVAKRFFISSEKTRYDMARELKKINIINDIKKRIKGKISYDKFSKNYAWAKPIVNKDEPTFHDLVEVTKYKELYILYKDSCRYVHADIYGSMTSLDKNNTEPLNLWNTEPSIYGTDNVILYLTIFLNLIRSDYFNEYKCAITILAISLPNGYKAIKNS